MLRTEAKGGYGSLYVFGVYHTYKRFWKIARSLWHPFDELRHLPDFLITTLFETLSSSRVTVAKGRLNLVKKWRQWANELQVEEDNLKANMIGLIRILWKTCVLALESREKLEQLAFSANSPKLPPSASLN